MTLLSGKRPLPDFSAYPPKYRHRKVAAYYGDHGPQVDVIPIENSEVGGEGNILPVKKSENLVRNDMECETSKPMLSNSNVEGAHWQWVTVDNDVKVFAKTPQRPTAIDVPEEIDEAKPITRLDSTSTFPSRSLPLVRKCPPLEIQKGVTPSCDFPSYRGKEDGIVVSNKVLGNKCIVEKMQAIDTKRTDGNQTKVPIQDGNGVKEMVDKIRSESVGCIRHEMNSRSIGGGKTSETEVIKDNSVLMENQDITKSSRGKDVVVGDIQEDVRPSKVRKVLNLLEETVTRLSNDSEAESTGKRRALKDILKNAAMLLRGQKKCLNTKKLIGCVPGVEIGDKFQYWAELYVIGLHHQFDSGIDFLKEDGKNFATSIVKSGRYGDGAAESSDVLVYYGQGGNTKIVNKPPKDQELVRGNLALKNSMEAGLPVRVILRTRETSPRTLTYDGLYKVTDLKRVRWKQSGKWVFKFLLERCAEQPKLGVNVALAKKPNVSRLPCVAINDISQGKERKPIRVVNRMDGEKLPCFHYVANVIYPEWYESIHSVPRGCDCINGCVDFEKCPCTVRYGGDIPFTLEGAIVGEKPLVYECGPSCKCPPSCQNRVSQNGIRYQLEIFKTEKKGWGVRSRDFIQSGGFVCEYAGELIQDQEAEERVGNDEYLFDVGNDGRDGGGFTIDAAKFGNVGRFINHSCSPNLYAQNVLFDQDDKRMPHIMFFATKNIPPLRELTYDYNYKVDEVRDGNGNIKRKDCYCGSSMCRGRLY